MTPLRRRGELVVAGVLAGIAILLLGLPNALLPDAAAQLFLIASFGPSAAILFGDPSGRSARPRAVIGGHLASAIVGVTVAQLLGGEPLLAAAVAVGVALGVMLATDTFHPPGGSTALLPVIGGASIAALGYSFVIAPVLTGAVALVIIAHLLRRGGDQVRRLARRDRQGAPGS